MKAKDLIKQLKDLVAEYGDLDVYEQSKGWPTYKVESAYADITRDNLKVFVIDSGD